MELVSILIVGLLGLCVGGAIGWLVGKARSSKADTQVETLRLQLDGVREERDAARGEYRDAVAAADAARDRAAKLDSELAGLKAGQAERERAWEERLSEIREAKELLSAQFSEVGQKLLGEAQRSFLERADQRFHQQGEKAEERIRQLLNPVGERLKAYEEQVGRIEKERTEAYGNLTGLIAEMKEGQQRVSSEAARLVNSLRNAPKARGRWGEQQLKNVLESCGLSEHVDFVTEHSITMEDGARLRPDAVIRTPGGRSLVVDAKVSLNAYQAAFEADDENERIRNLDLHAKSMRNHVQTLGSKSYQSQFDDTPDYVVMFVPGEHFVAAALEHDPELWDFAFRNKVLLATPTNLVAIARTVAQVWRQDKMAEEAAEIGRLGAELYDRLRVSAEHMKRVGGGLETAVNNYNKFVGSFERNVLTSGRRMAEKGIEIGKKEIEEVPLVESTPRYNAEDAALIGNDGQPDREAAE